MTSGCSLPAIVVNTWTNQSGLFRVGIRNIRLLGASNKGTEVSSVRNNLEDKFVLYELSTSCENNLDDTDELNTYL